MKIDRLLHVNIRCSPTDLPKLEKFYESAKDADPYDWMYYRPYNIHFS